MSVPSVSIPPTTPTPSPPSLLIPPPSASSDGSERRCHSQLFIRPHIHSLSITVRPPGPLTSLYVYYSVPPSPCRPHPATHPGGRMIDVFQEGGPRWDLRAPLLHQSRRRWSAGASQPRYHYESVSRHARNNNTRRLIYSAWRQETWRRCASWARLTPEGAGRSRLEELRARPTYFSTQPSP